MEHSLRFLTKLWNACRFSSAHLKDFVISQVNKTKLTFLPIDDWILNKLNHVIEIVTDSFAKYNFHLGLMEFRNFFWHDFCDNYLEAVKYRLYSDEVETAKKISGKYTIYKVILDSLKLFAPIAPFITEEIYHSLFNQDAKNPSIHLLPWPTPQCKIPEPSSQQGSLIIKIISKFRAEKSQSGTPLNAPIKKAILVYFDKLEGLDYIKKDLAGTLKIEELILSKERPRGVMEHKFEMPEEKLEIHWTI
jgi:valyl-tRNA synthetase